MVINVFLRVYISSHFISSRHNNCYREEHFKNLEDEGRKKAINKREDEKQDQEKNKCECVRRFVGLCMCCVCMCE